MKKILLYIPIILFLSQACVEDYDLEISDLSKKYTVDAIVSTDSSLNYVRLSYFHQNNTNTSFRNPGLESLHDSIAVKGANVFVIDQNNDTTHFKEITEQKLRWKVGAGHYAPPSNFRGKEGYKYKLIINIEGDIISSSSELIKGPKIDKIIVEERQLEIQKDLAYVPLISFKDPNKNETNYYITNIFEDYLSAEYTGSNRNWGYAVFNDELLNENVENYTISSGTSPTSQAWYPYSPNNIKIRMLTVTKEVYQFYQSLISQIENQGGVFSQTPGSHSSNIKGNAEGCFICADVSEIIHK